VPSPLEQARDWWDKAPNLQVYGNYPPAKQVWLKMIREGGPVFDILDAVTKDDGDRANLVRDRSQELSDPKSLRRTVQRLRKKGPTNEIEGGAYQQIERLVSEAVGFGEAWLASRGQQRTGHAQAAEALRQSVGNNLSRAVEQLESL